MKRLQMHTVISDHNPCSNIEDMPYISNDLEIPAFKVFLGVTSYACQIGEPCAVQKVAATHTTFAQL